MVVVQVFVGASAANSVVLAVPPFLRNKARAIKVVELAPAGVKDDIHKRTS